MLRGRGTYSTLVGLLKVGLPLLAFGLLAAVFLISPEDELEGGLLFQEADLAALGDGLRIANPQLSGQTAEGTRYLFDAEVVTPTDASLRTAAVEGVTGDVALSDGRGVTLSAPRAAFDMEDQSLRFPDGIALATSDGYRLEATAMAADLRAAVFRGEGGVEATGPAGRITAERLRIDGDSAGDKNPMIWFEGRVKVWIDPTGGRVLP